MKMPRPSAPALAGALPWRAPGRSPIVLQEKNEACGRTGSGGHSRVARPVKWAAAGASAWRRRRSDAGPPGPGERLKSDFATHWYQFCICDTVSMLRMSMHGVRMFTELVFCRGRHGQESEESKEDREASHQEGGKEDLKEKEVIVSAIEKLPPPGRNPDAKRNLSKGSEISFAAVWYRGKAL
jgi:hypothetical protein